MHEIFARVPENSGDCLVALVHVPFVVREKNPHNIAFKERAVFFSTRLEGLFRFFTFGYVTTNTSISPEFPISIVKRHATRFEYDEVTIFMTIRVFCRINWESVSKRIQKSTINLLCFL